MPHFPNSSVLSILICTGYFNRKEIIEEINEYLENEFSEFVHLKSVSHKLVNMMFGRTTSSLRQLATRSIFHHCFLRGGCCLTKLMPSDTLKQRFSNADLTQMDVYDEYINFVLNRTVLRALVVRLNLPQDSLLNFEVELLLHQIASKFSSFKIMQPESFYSDSDDSAVSDDSESSSLEEGDSDLEYW